MKLDKNTQHKIEGLKTALEVQPDCFEEEQKMDKSKI